MKKLLKAMAMLVCIAALTVLASCNTEAKIDAAVKDATAGLVETVGALNTEISELEGSIGELEEEIAALESERDALAESNAAADAKLEELGDEIEALESEKLDMLASKEALEEELRTVSLERCGAGIHEYDGHSEVEFYYEALTYTDHTGLELYGVATTTCVNGCRFSERVELEKVNNGEYLATFSAPLPSHTFEVPEVYSIGVDENDPAYDSSTGIYHASELVPLVLTVKGINLDELNDKAPIYFIFSSESTGVSGRLYSYDLTDYISVADPETMTVTFNYELLMAVAEGLGETYTFDIAVRDPLYDLSESSVITVTLPEPEPEFTIVNNEEEFRAALANNEPLIRLGADIVSEEGFEIFYFLTLDLAGHDLKVTGVAECTFWTLGELHLTDSVGGARIYKDISINSGKVIISGSFICYTDVGGTGELDLGGYTGMPISVESVGLTQLILPAGYVCKDREGNILTDLASMNEASDVTVMPADYDYFSAELPFTTVYTLQELKLELLIGGKIRLGADINLDGSLSLYKPTMLDLAGHKLSIEDKYAHAIFSMADLVLTDSVGGSLITNSIIMSNADITISGSVEINCTGYSVYPSGAIDLSGYTGERLTVDMYDVDSIVLPEGYEVHDIEAGKKLESMDEILAATALIISKPADTE